MDRRYLRLIFLSRIFGVLCIYGLDTVFSLHSGLLDIRRIWAMQQLQRRAIRQKMVSGNQHGICTAVFLFVRRFQERTTVLPEVDGVQGSVNLVENLQ